jgi:hypothetical protein
VRKYTLDVNNVFAGSSFILFDTAGQNRCAAGIACQPIAASPAIARRIGNDFTAFIGTGGADWARTIGNQSYVFGFDPTAMTEVNPIFAQQLGTVKPPIAAGIDVPLRVYSQPTIAGSDLYVQGTTVSINTINALIEPILFPGTYGSVLRWGGLNTATIDGSATWLIKQGDNFSGGMGGVLETNTTSTDGKLTILGTANIQRIALAAGSTSLRNRAYAVTQDVSNGRPFSVMTWFDLIN